MVQVFKTTVKKRFFAPRLSWAYLSKIVAWILIILLPFLFAWWSHAFWKEHDTFLETPAVVFKRQALVVLEGSKGSSDPIVFSTMPNVNRVIGGTNSRAGELTVLESDHNLDGANDVINITLDVPLRTGVAGAVGGVTGETVTKISAALFFRFQLRNRLNLDMESVLFVEASTSLPSSSLTVMGNLYLRQREPLYVRRSRIVYAPSILDDSTVQSASDVSITKLMRNSFARNETVELARPLLHHWESGGQSSFRLKLEIVIPEQTVWYVPDAVELLKFAWIQYYALAVIVYFFVDWAREFCHENRIVDVRARTDASLQAKEHQY